MYQVVFQCFVIYIIVYSDNFKLASNLSEFSDFSGHLLSMKEQVQTVLKEVATEMLESQIRSGVSAKTTRVHQQDGFIEDSCVISEVPAHF